MDKLQEAAEKFLIKKGVNRKNIAPEVLKDFAEFAFEQSKEAIQELEFKLAEANKMDAEIASGLIEYQTKYLQAQEQIQELVSALEIATENVHSPYFDSIIQKHKQ